MRTIEKITPLAKREEMFTQKRVAAYARVSLRKEAMLHSLSVQISQYSSLIQGTSGWRYAGVYADEAVSGTKRNRPEFQRMLEDCRAGKIDMIITKSLSRFARNTLTTLQTVRELRLLGVDVYFEKDYMKTLINSLFIRIC
jgi:DNA invertase Pin-like site-specific DNA recombinase